VRHPLGAFGELLDTPQAAAYIKIAPRTLEVWRATKRHPIPYIKVGGRVRYRVEDLDLWLASRVVICEPR
jgi:hypothetical protein